MMSITNFLDSLPRPTRNNAEVMCSPGGLRIRFPGLSTASMSLISNRAEQVGLTHHVSARATLDVMGFDK